MSLGIGFRRQTKLPLNPDMWYELCDSETRLLPWNAVLLETSESSWKKELWLCLSQKEKRGSSLKRTGLGEVAGVALLWRKWWGAGMEIHNDLEAGAGWGMLSQLCHPAAWSPGSPRYIPKHMSVWKELGSRLLSSTCKWHPAPQLLAHSGRHNEFQLCPMNTYSQRFKRYRCLGIHTPSISLIQLLYTLPGPEHKSISTAAGSP